MKRLGFSLACAAALFAAVACAGGATKDAAPAAAAKPAAAKTAAAPAAAKKLEITEASFSCIRNMKAVRGYYVSNLSGATDATVKVAMAGTGAYPVGSVVQLVPGEAMVKREPGFSPASKDWEFFELDTTPAGTKIRVRGTSEAVNRFGGNCLSCHAKAQPQYDMVCETGHGCDPLPLTPVMLKAIQNTDPRCPKMELPPEQIEALKALSAFMRPAAPKPANP